MKAVHFGPGNIGRGFIGLLLSKSGYDVCFVARNKKQIAMLQQRKQYPVTLANENEDTSIVRNVTAINGNDSRQVNEAIAEADLITTAVGVSNLKHIAPAITTGIEHRFKTNDRPLNIMACENAIGASTHLKKMVYKLLPAELHEKADRLLAFPNTAVDRIVPAQDNEDPLEVTVEPFYEWVILRPAMKEGPKEIKGAHYVESLEPYIERKLFTVNTGHCCAAYFGYLEGYRTIQEVMASPRLRQKVKEVLQETGKVLIRKHQLDEKKHQRYIDKTIDRFANPNLKDSIVRVGRSPIRKLSANDRLVRPALLAYQYGIEIPQLISAMAAGLLFDYKKDPEAVKLQEVLRKRGIHHVIGQYLGIEEDHPIHRQIVDEYEKLAKGIRKKNAAM
ncbi:mannitol-1-phosphate 5-dehydrogenase [Paenibacillus beijingensis]|uniref:Mannitol-1-phosphate 5-dehydrogenase n=1 Tax=Paenibacillus beijingensis TaxID=1126833 RepID=A0A0D5NPA0_9BACL|nr:mannitol-1-phosphate 5-dehydrogenase [Paenibacillus beijingensis]AJY77000.1 mannitol-1-phosphate 5-dehydrogenase [Paenibacillus beijingensis]